MNRMLRHSRVPNAASAFDDFLRQAKRAEYLGLDMEEWLEKYMPPSGSSADVIYQVGFRAKAMLDAHVQEVKQ